MNLLDPFAPSTPDPSGLPVAAAAPAAPANSNITQQWSDALNDPTVRTSLLQAGISLMQPPGFGQSASGAIGRAIGSAGEALSRQDETALKKQEADSKAALRESQASSAETRANAASAVAGARADAAGSALDLKRGQLDLAGQRLSLSQILGRQRRQIDASNAYSRYMTTRSPLDTDKTLTRDEFYQKSGFGDLLGSGNEPNMGPTGLADPNAELAKAQAAIAGGANPDLVRQRYKQRTGSDMP